MAEEASARRAAGTPRRSHPQTDAAVVRRLPDPPREAFRTALVNRLRAARSYALATIVAPPGYGKTTLLTQWASRDDRTFLTAGPSTPLAELDRLVSRWSTTGEPAVLVFDDAHLLTGEATAAVSRLVAATPPGSMVVLAGQYVPPLPHPSLPRLRADGRLLELGARDLAMTRREAAAALKTCGTPVTPEQLTTLLESTEGWAAGISQAVSSLRTTGRPELNGETSAFFREVCGALTPEQRAFLRRTSVLERMSGPLCDAVLATTGSARELERLDRAHLFLTPLDHRSEWYRYHRLLRAELQRALADEEPALVSVLHRRAADWLEQHGDLRPALDHAFASGESSHLVRIFAGAALAAHDRGGDFEIEDGLARMDESAALREDAGAAVLAARLHLHRGRLAEAERCVAAATEGLTRDGHETSVGARVALVHAALCAGGAEVMLTDAECALSELPSDDTWRPYGLMLQGTAYWLLEEPERADAILSRAVHAAERLGAHETHALALAERAIGDAARDDHATAEVHLARARGMIEREGLDAYPTSALAVALSAQALLREGRWVEAQLLMTATGQLVTGLTSALPWLAVQARLELAAAYVMLRDAAGAGALVRQADEILAVRPRLGRLRAQREALATRIHAIPPGREGQTPRLTGAELRLLPLLGTHLSFREIGARLFLSRHTVKTQAISAYRKLGASSRREAVLNASRLGLVEAPDSPRASS